MGSRSGHILGSNLTKLFPILTEVFSGVHYFLWAKARLVPLLGHDCFLLILSNSPQINPPTYW